MAVVLYDPSFIKDTIFWSIAVSAVPKVNLPLYWYEFFQGPYIILSYNIKYKLIDK